jgi:hypothetical protein
MSQRWIHRYMARIAGWRRDYLALRALTLTAKPLVQGEH